MLHVLIYLSAGDVWKMSQLWTKYALHSCWNLSNARTTLFKSCIQTPNGPFNMFERLFS